MPMLTLRNVSMSYAGRKILSGLDYQLDEGEYVAIMGESGVGKSTLLNLIAGLDTPDAGEVVIDGVSLAGMDDDRATRLRREKLGFVFQAFHILPHLTLVQNVALPLLLNGREQERARMMLEAVGLGTRTDDFPRQLSGGEMQRVAIARALVHRPRLLLADEPTGNLDPDTAREVLDLLRNELKQNGGAGILVTHSPLAAASADRILLLTRTGLQPFMPKAGE